MRKEAWNAKFCRLIVLGALLTEVFPTIFIILESTPFAFSYPE